MQISDADTPIYLCEHPEKLTNPATIIANVPAPVRCRFADLSRNPFPTKPRPSLISTSFDSDAGRRRGQACLSLQTPEVFFRSPVCRGSNYFYEQTYPLLKPDPMFRFPTAARLGANNAALQINVMDFRVPLCALIYGERRRVLQ